MVQTSAAGHNREVEIQSYRIYSLGETLRPLGEVEAGSREYHRRGADGDSVAIYGIAAVTDDGEESLPAVVYVRP